MAKDSTWRGQSSKVKTQKKSTTQRSLQLNRNQLERNTQSKSTLSSSLSTPSQSLPSSSSAHRRSTHPLLRHTTVTSLPPMRRDVWPICMTPLLWKKSDLRDGVCCYVFLSFHLIDPCNHCCCFNLLFVVFASLFVRKASAAVVCCCCGGRDRLAMFFCMHGVVCIVRVIQSCLNSNDQKVFEKP